MSEKVLLTVKTDKKLKLAAQKVAKQMGVPLGTIINAQLRQIVDEGSYTFSIPAPKTGKGATRLRRISRDTSARNWSGPFTNPDDVRAFLDSLKN